mmetsp:Transcript_12312/g.23558  ORF Transcript_12312/g.23558 Transcript_12312/m.23558 type:complete len:407 (-) Transcript_12312:74-1294(-)
MITKHLKPSRTIVTSFNPRKTPVSADDANSSSTSSSASSLYEGGDWVLCLAASSNSIACALSSGEVQVYDQERLHLTQTFPRGAPASYSSMAPATITSLVYAPKSPVLVSTDTSGALAVMDLRQGQRTTRISLPTPALSLGLGYEEGHLAAVGSDRGRIHFTDLRQPGSLLGTYIDSHTDDVTQVTFCQQNNPTMLLSGAEDGLVCVFDTTQPTEETARKSVCSVGTAVRHVGFCGNNSSNIYCLTGSETLSLWHVESATAVRDYGWETRSRLSQAAGIAIDYVVDAGWNETTKQLMVMAGTSAGDSVLYSLGGNSNEFRAEYLLQGGHRGVVRAWTPLQPTMSAFMTAGEDARLCEWRPTPNFTVPTDMSTALPSRPAVKRPITVGGPMSGPIRRQKSKTKASPY